MRLRPYQHEDKLKIFAAWNAGHRNVLYVLPTGGGKSLLSASVMQDYPGVSVAIAHRQELVGQLSLALAKVGVVHHVISPPDVIREINQIHTEELGKSYYSTRSQVAVAGVDTLMSWSNPKSKQYQWLMRWANGIRLWMCDESHHPSGVSPRTPDDFMTGNKWAKAIALFPNAVGLGVTATPERADGKGLGRGQDGVFDHMIVGPGMRDLINGLPDWDGGVSPYLTDYRIVSQPSDLDLSTVNTGADGDYIRGQLALKTRQSSVMGDVVEHYLKWTPGKLGITFAPDVETASELAVRFQAAGVPAEMLCAKTPGKLRREILRRFKARRILQLVNVDLFGEGFDLPAIEVVSMARATQSYGLYVQMFGRALRLMEGKQVAWILDHVGNVIRHGGPPDRPRVWTLDRREKRSSGKQADDVVPLRQCLNPECMGVFERTLPACPACGWIPKPQARTAPEFVDGDLLELDAATLAAMRGEVARIDQHPDAVRDYMLRGGAPAVAAYGAAKQHAARIEAQAVLRESMSWWGWTQRQAGKPDAVSYREFYHKFGIDVLSAQVLGKPQAEALTARINKDIGRN